MFFIIQDINEGSNINQVYDFDKHPNNLNNENENNSDVYIMESLIKELEEKLGLKLFKDTYDIIQDNVS